MFTTGEKEFIYRDARNSESARETNLIMQGIHQELREQGRFEGEGRRALSGVLGNEMAC